MKFTTSCDSVASNAPPGSGSASAPATTTLTPGSRARHACANPGEGSAPYTLSAPSSRASCAVSAPGPQPTSSARIPGLTPANSISAAPSRAP